MASATVGSPISWCQCFKLVPVLYLELAGDDGGAPFVAVFDDLEEVSALGIGQWREAEVVEYEEVWFGDLVDGFCVGAGAPGDIELLEEPWDSGVEGSVSVPACFVDKGAGEPGFSEAARASDDEVLALPDPVAGGESLDNRAVEAGLKVRVNSRADSHDAASRCNS
jgi:hypothetical protein